MTRSLGEALLTALGLRGVLACAGVVSVALMLGFHVILGVDIVRLMGLLAVGGILVGVVLYRGHGGLPRPPWRTEPWLLIAAGVGVLAVTNAGMAAGSSGSGRPDPLAVVALAGYPLLIIGLLRLLNRRLPDREADVLVQAGLVATVFALAMWAVISSDGNDLQVPLGTAVTSIALPALDLALLTVAIHLLLLPGERIFVYRAVALAVCYLLGVHILAALGTATDWQVPPDLVGVLLLCSFAFWALGALDPSMHRLSDPMTDDPPGFSPGHLVLTQMGMLAAPAVIALHAVRQVAIPGPLAVGAGVVSVVLAAYLGSLLWQRSAMERRAHRDELTGLPNRALFGDRLCRALAHARRNELPVVVMFVDLDRFKEINDGFGHTAGDELLRQVARRLESCVREEDTVARLGGDEFALLMPHISGIDGAVKVAARLLGAFTSPISLAEHQVVITPSIGISLYPQDGADAHALIEGADTAMYRAKDSGRNTYEIFSPALRTEAHERLALESDIRRALEHDEFVLHYQPKVDLRTGRVVGAEALVRWNHPEQGLLFPGHFVPLAEESGQIVALGEFVIATACEQLQAWQAQGLPLLGVSVNISARQLHHGLVDFVASALRHTGLDPRLLELELTESAALESIDVTMQELGELRAMGVVCSLDDFGTGYCGLSYLSRLPIDALKIDKSFIHAMSDAGDPLVTAITALGHSLGLKVIAEGVETPEQLAYITERGCDEMQGYLFSKPVPASEFARLVLGPPSGFGHDAARRDTVDPAPNVGHLEGAAPVSAL